MKTRISLVSNSSSCSFIITNKSDKELTIVDFVWENPQLLVEFLDQYEWYKKDPRFTQALLIDSAMKRLSNTAYMNDGVSIYSIPPKTSRCLVFGDEEGDTIGRVFDYILRDGGESEHFRWQMDEMLR